MTETLSKYRSLIILVLVLIISAVLGGVTGTSWIPIESTGLWQLEPSYQAMYVQAVADAYAADGNDALAVQRLSFLCQTNDQINTAMNQAQDPQWYGADPVKAANIDQLRTLVPQVTQNTDVAVCNTRAINTWARLGRIAAPVLLVLMAIGLVGYSIFLAPAEAAAPSATRATAVPKPGAAKAPPAQQETVPSKKITKDEAKELAPSVAAAGAKLSQQAEKTDFAAMGEDPPIVQFMTTFLHGDDLYDDSFSIEKSSGEFLGETGVGISETISSEGDAKNVTALEVWLFDKNDIRTVTKVLMSDHAFNDDALRAKLAPKGEAVNLKPGMKVTLDTATLRVQARIVDMSYKDLMPPKSVIDRITIELASWQREGQKSGGPVPGGAGTPPGGLPPMPGGSG